MVNTRVDKDTIVGEVQINASPETVFEALTDPNKLKSWWGDEKTYRADKWTIDLRVGGKWRSDGKSSQGDPFTVEGEYVEVDPPRVLAYTWRPSWIEVPPTKVRFVLKPKDSGTHLIVERSGFSGYREALENHLQGWPIVLQWLQSYAGQN